MPIGGLPVLWPMEEVGSFPRMPTWWTSCPLSQRGSGEAGRFFSLCILLGLRVGV